MARTYQPNDLPHWFDAGDAMTLGGGQEIPAPANVARGRLKAWLLGGVIFALGVVTGAAGGVIVVQKMVEFRFKHPGLVFEEMLDTMERRLALSASQRSEIEAIMHVKRLEFLDIVKEVHPRLEGHMLGLKEVIRQQLTPEQAAKWDAEFDRMRKTLLPPPPPFEDAIPASR